jgi:hypothetical protein
VNAYRAETGSDRLRKNAARRGAIGSWRLAVNLYSASIYYRIDDLGELASGFRQGIKVVLAGTARLDETSMTQERKVVADSGLALSAEVRAKLGHISLFFTKKHQYL